MRACFLGQSVTALGFGVATLQTPRLVLDEETGKPVEDHADRPSQAVQRQDLGAELVRRALRKRPL